STAGTSAMSITTSAPECTSRVAPWSALQIAAALCVRNSPDKQMRSPSRRTLLTADSLAWWTVEIVPIDNARHAPGIHLAGHGSGAKAENHADQGVVRLAVTGNLVRAAPPWA